MLYSSRYHSTTYSTTMDSHWYRGAAKVAAAGCYTCHRCRLRNRHACCHGYKYSKSFKS